MVSEEVKKELAYAIKAYGDILWRVYLGLDVPEEFREYTSLSASDLKNKMTLLREFYDSL